MPDSIEKLSVSDDGFALPAEEVLTGRGFVTGKSGSGKSNTATVIVEELLQRNLPLLIVDTDGEYVGLQESFDLLHAGASDACDLQISSETADQLTSYALEDHVPIVLDVSTYRDEAETEAVLHETIESLFVAEQEHRIPFLILLEEAHEFIPQQGGRGGSDLKSLLIRVAKRGRKRGLGICSLSQRPAAVDKDFITQCNWFVWHRLTWENDTDVVARIIGNEWAEAVQSLEDGEALVQTDWSESIERVQFRLRRTDEAGSTPSLEDLDRAGKSRTGRTEKSSSTSEERNAAANPDEEPPTAEPTRTDLPEPTEVSYDESTISASPGSGPDPKPSLERRRRRREKPADATDPLWEIGELVVYVYDTMVWYHLFVISKLEQWVAEAVRRTDDAFVGRRRPRRPGRYEQYAYRLVAILAVMACYGLLVLVPMLLP